MNPDKHDITTTGLFARRHIHVLVTCSPPNKAKPSGKMAHFPVINGGRTGYIPEDPVVVSFDRIAEKGSNAYPDELISCIL